MERVYVDTLGELLTSYPDGLIKTKSNNRANGWIFRDLSYNRYIPDDYVRDNLDKPWDYDGLLSNPALSTGTRLLILNSVALHSIPPRIILELDILNCLISRYSLANICNSLSVISYNLTVEASQHVYQSDCGKMVDWSLVQRECPAEVLKWLISEHSDLVDWKTISINNRIDGEIIEMIISDHYQYWPNMVSNKRMSNQHRIDIINHCEFVINNNINKLITYSHSMDVIEALLAKIPYTNKYRTLLELDGFRVFITLTPIDQSLIYSLLKEASSDRELVQILSNPSVSDDILIQLIQDHNQLIEIGVERDCIVNYIMIHYIETKRSISMRVISELIEEGHDLTQLGSSIEKIYDQEIQDINLYLYNSARLSGLIIKVNSLIGLDEMSGKIEYSKLNNRNIIRLDFKIDIETIEHIKTNKSIIPHLDWDYLTERVDYDIILTYPKLKWTNCILSKRKYLPPARMMKTKVAGR